MIELIVGGQGKGKTGKMLEKVNSEIKEASGNIVYLDKNTKHMYELNNKIRLVDVSEYNFSNCDEFYGFICGIISQDHDLEQVYFDNFKRIACIDDSDLEVALDKFAALGEARKIKFCISIAAEEAVIPAKYKENIVVSL
ncbi:MAG: twitching motility protein PilT [Lachnospiraceae bacterium]|nr:twitching motility protein PilT [Lachnospiraceae bacterium]MBR6157080.1 twitching motility protein PilT [Lachnospiraceae bacterium]